MSMKQFADPIYGYISIPQKDLSVIDEPRFQRLRRVKQLGFSSIVYPGATHTRFSHSIGAYYIASELMDVLDSYQYQREAEVAALLHDIGHGPYSHASEDVFEELPEHEQVSCDIVTSFAENGVMPDDVNTDIVIELISGERTISPIAGDIDADRIDYLLRDAHFTGVPHGEFDWRTIIQSATIEPVNGEDRICFDFRAKQAIESMLLSRKSMHKSVYKHPTGLIAERMFEKVLKNTDVSIKPEEIYTLDDTELLSQIEQHATGVSKDVYQRLKNRELYKSALELRERPPEQVVDYLENNSHETIEAEIAHCAGVDSEYVLCEINIQSESDAPENLDIFIKEPSGSITSIHEISQIGSVVEESDSLSVQFGIYTPKTNKHNIRKNLNNHDVLSRLTQE